MKVAKRILVVDDEPDLRDALQLLLEAKGYEIVTASGGADALEILGKDKFDLVVLDYFMPEMTGRDVADKIRSDPQLKDQKIAFLTVAVFGDVGREDLEALGALDYIQKPFDNDDFVKRIKKMIGE